MGSIKVKLTAASDIDKMYDDAYSVMDAAAAKVKSAIQDYGTASTKLKAALDKTDSAIAAAKELGVPTQVFDTRKINIKNAQSKADKNASISILQ